jgi:hypothetical protein
MPSRAHSRSVEKQSMGCRTQNIANGLGTNNIIRIRPSGGTFWGRIAFEVGIYNGSGGLITCKPLIGNGRLLFTRINLMQVVDTGILPRCMPRLDKGRHCDSCQNSYNGHNNHYLDNVKACC